VGRLLDVCEDIHCCGNERQLPMSDRLLPCCLVYVFS